MGRGFFSGWCLIQRHHPLQICTRKNYAYLADPVFTLASVGSYVPNGGADRRIGNARGVHTHKHTHEQPALQRRPVGSASLREVLLCFCFGSFIFRPARRAKAKGAGSFLSVRPILESALLKGWNQALEQPARVPPIRAELYRETVELGPFTVQGPKTPGAKSFQSSTEPGS